ncbi:MAG: response regulator [Desulfovibrionaceae bacterium]
MQRFRVVITDKNHNVRAILRRTFAERRFDVAEAMNGNEVAAFLNDATPPHVIVLDPDIPGAEKIPALERRRDPQFCVPIVLHCLAEPAEDEPLRRRATAIVEKQGDVSRLTEAVRRILLERYLPDAETREALLHDAL